MPVVESYIIEVGVYFPVAIIVDSHGGSEISIGVPGYEGWDSPPQGTAPVVTRLKMLETTEIFIRK